MRRGTSDVLPCRASASHNPPNGLSPSRAEYTHTQQDHSYHHRSTTSSTVPAGSDADASEDPKLEPSTSQLAFQVQDVMARASMSWIGGSGKALVIDADASFLNIQSSPKGTFIDEEDEELRSSSIGEGETSQIDNCGMSVVNRNEPHTIDDAMLSLSSLDPDLLAAVSKSMMGCPGGPQSPDSVWTSKCHITEDCDTFFTSCISSFSAQYITIIALDVDFCLKIPFLEGLKQQCYLVEADAQGYMTRVVQTLGAPFRSLGDYLPDADEPNAPIWQAFETLGLIDRYKTIIATVGYEFIERHVLETCAGEWSRPLLGELRDWMSDKAVLWMLLIYARGATNAEEARVMLQDIGSRFDFHINKTLCNLRTREIWDLIIDFPDSTGALQDLRDCIQCVDHRSSPVQALCQAFVSLPLPLSILPSDA
ncbi:Anaphase-promoting complex subunit 2 [Leucoagaricus sp. SymC.cos]|nr:Anaphase-promoting complex subunit 2 [Leucoagaricus sp. SymC.cos]